MPRLGVTDVATLAVLCLLALVAAASVAHGCSIAFTTYSVRAGRIGSIDAQRKLHPTLAFDAPHNTEYITKDTQFAAAGAFVPALWAGVSENFGAVALHDIYKRASDNIAFEILMPTNSWARAVLAVVLAIGLFAMVIAFMLSAAAVIMNRDKLSTWKDIKQGKASSGDSAISALARKINTM
jgi:hypothetical protein